MKKKILTAMQVLFVVLVWTAFSYAANGTLKVSSFPTGAEVLVDGASTGKVTPMNVSLPEGEHQVTVQIPNSGWAPNTRSNNCAGQQRPECHAVANSHTRANRTNWAHRTNRSNRADRASRANGANWIRGPSRNSGRRAEPAPGGAAALVRGEQDRFEFPRRCTTVRRGL